MSVPAGFMPDGLPVGLEFVAAPYDETTVFRLGFAFEQATYHRRLNPRRRELCHRRHEGGHEGELRPPGGAATMRRHVLDHVGPRSPAAFTPVI